MKSPRLLFLTDNFPPEANAPANRTYEHCIEWVKLGVEVTVITCQPNFPMGEVFEGYRNRLYQTELMDGIKVVRVWSYITPNRGTTKRMLDYLSYAFSSFFASLFHPADIIIATSPQLFTAVGGMAAGFVKRTPWIMEVRDLWPESIQALGAINNTRLLKMLESLVSFLYKNAHQIVVVTDTFKERISQEGIDPAKISIIKNGVNPKRYFISPPNIMLKKKLGLEEKFVIGYIGTHGMAHSLDFILDCASKVSDPDIHFLLIGEGAMKNRLLRQKEELGLSNVTMLDFVTREEVPGYISIIDVALVPLKKTDTFKTVIPSKIFENAAMGKPILLGVEGESERILKQYQAGSCFEPENEASFHQELLRLKNDTAFYEQCKEGCVHLAKEFNRTNLAVRMLNDILPSSYQALLPTPSC